MVLGGIAGDVSKAQVHSLLLARAPDLLEVGSEEAALFEEAVRGIASEVVPLTGADPSPGPRRDLGVWCITLGVSAQIEAALFPEQQETTGRAEYLERRYLAALKQLRGLPVSPEDGATPPGGTVGRFPDAQPYPDPVR